MTCYTVYSQVHQNANFNMRTISVENFRLIQVLFFSALLTFKLKYKFYSRRLKIFAVSLTGSSDEEMRTMLI